MSQTPNRRPLRSRTALRAPVRRQRGVVLMIALIVLVALTLAGLSMVRTSDTGSVIAGNISLRQTALQAAEPGLESAIAALAVGGTAIAANFATANVSNAGNGYSHLLLAADANTGLPGGASFKAVPNTTPVLSGYTVRYFIERMCVEAPANPDEISQKCLADKMQQVQAVGVDQPKFPDRYKVNYRVSVLVDGPRNTQSLVQTVFLY